MDFFRLTMRILSALLSVYSFVIFLNIILSWVQTRTAGMMKMKSYLGRLADPYMNRFRGIGWLRFGNLDFSPLLGLLILYFAIFLTDRLAATLYVSWWEILFWLVIMITRMFTGILIFLGAAMLVRLVILTLARTSSAFLRNLDAVLFPIISRMIGFFTSRTLSYQAALVLVGVLFILGGILIRWGMNELIGYLIGLLTRG